MKNKEPLVDPEFRDLLPQHTPEEFAGLEAQILKDGGIRNSGLVWKEQNLVVDGHTRREISKRHNLKMFWEEISFPDRQAVIQWIVDHQLGRRNLTDKQRAYYLGREYLAALKADREKSAAGTGPRTAEQVAARHGVGEKTVRRAGKFAAAVDATAAEQGDHVKADLLSGKKAQTEVIQTSPVPTTKRRKKQRRSGSVAYDWRKVHCAIGVIARSIAQVKAAYPEAEHLEAKGLHRLMDEVTKAVKAWQKKLTASSGD